MKLLTKTSLNFLSLSLFIFLFGIIAFYYLLRFEIDRNINRELEKRKAELILHLKSAPVPDEPVSIHGEKIYISPLKGQIPLPQSYADTLLYQQERYIPFRKLTFIAYINQQPYNVEIFRSLEGSDKLIINILLLMTLLVFLIIIALLVMNRYSSRKAWKEFYHTIEQINQYDVDTHAQFSLAKSDIKEFDDLNRVLSAMTRRIRNDYHNLKEYTENASHEFQNPLAIINSKLEVLLQSDDLQPAHARNITEAYQAANRISRLNKTLLLLAKIENRQFPDSKRINVVEIIDSQFEFLEDLIRSKKLNIIKEYEANPDFSMNPYLAEILFVNLIKNAIRHNVKGGRIIINLKKNKFTLSNSGPDLALQPEMLFKRFEKSSNSPESFGLGLSIVKKICEIYGYTISYQYKDYLHGFSIENFGKET